jgi:hypothetical protein
MHVYCIFIGCQYHGFTGSYCGLVEEHTTMK